MHLLTFIPACEGFGWVGGPEFNTRIKVLMNGRERRNANWANAKHRYVLPFLNLGTEDYASVRQVFEVSRGMLHTFLYRDPNDYQAIDALFAVADGRTTYQLNKVSTLDGVSYQRLIYALYSPNADGTAAPSAPVVTVNGTPTAVTVDYDRGTVTFAVAPTPGAVLRWTGEFSIWVRFNTDRLAFSIDNRLGTDYARNGQVELLEDDAPVEVET